MGEKYRCQDAKIVQKNDTEKGFNFKHQAQIPVQLMVGQPVCPS
jgi:hypothetical protein